VEVLVSHIGVAIFVEEIQIDKIYDAGGSHHYCEHVKNHRVNILVFFLLEKKRVAIQEQ
jgi:hypothetical protein